jgi:hypothetical protein
MAQATAILGFCPSALLLTALGLGACGNPPTLAPASDSADAHTATRGYPGTLLPVTAFESDFQWRQRVTADWQGKQHHFDAVLAKDGGTLKLIGLGPMNTPGFVVRLQGQRVELDNRSSLDLKFNPRWVMLDIQRTFYPWFQQPAKAAGDRQTELYGERIYERWQRGRLQERRFRRLDDQPPGEIVVQYEGWPAGADAPERATLTNEWFGYSLVVETLEQQRSTTAD